MRGLLPGESASTVFTLDGGDPHSRYFSYAWMVIPSNDAFNANADPTLYDIFDRDGGFLGANFVVLGSDVNQLGTEVNDEGFRTTAALGQLRPDTGTAQGGVVANHPGLLPPGVGGPDDGALDDPRFANGRFEAPGYRVASVTVELDGNDAPRGGDLQDILRGGFGADDLRGHRGDDLAFGGVGRDRIVGNAGADRLCGDSGDEVPEGGLGVDLLEGGSGDDRLDGGQADDRLAGGRGDDVPAGGGGADRFACDAGTGDDRALGVDFAAGDRLVPGLDNAGQPFSVDANANGDAVLSLDGATATLVGAAAADANEAYLVFFRARLCPPRAGAPFRAGSRPRPGPARPRAR